MRSFVLLLDTILLIWRHPLKATGPLSNHAQNLHINRQSTFQDLILLKCCHVDKPGNKRTLAFDIYHWSEAFSRTGHHSIPNLWMMLSYCWIWSYLIFCCVPEIPFNWLRISGDLMAYHRSLVYYIYWHLATWRQRSPYVCRCTYDYMGKRKLFLRPKNLNN